MTTDDNRPRTRCAECGRLYIAPPGLHDNGLCCEHDRGRGDPALDGLSNREYGRHVQRTKSTPDDAALSVDPVEVFNSRFTPYYPPVREVL